VFGTTVKWLSRNLPLLKGDAKLPNERIFSVENLAIRVGWDPNQQRLLLGELVPGWWRTPLPSTIQFRAKNAAVSL
jgi:hypothetical protein